MRALVKHTIIIWSEPDLEDLSVEDIARQSTDGEAHCSSHTTQLIEDPTRDPDWEDTEFFGDGDEDEDTE